MIGQNVYIIGISFSKSVRTEPKQENSQELEPDH